MTDKENHLLKYHLPVAVIGNEVPKELTNININWFFVYKEEVDKIDLTQFVCVIINGFFNVSDDFVQKLRDAVKNHSIGVIFKKNESVSNKLGLTRGNVKHFYNFKHHNTRLHNRKEHPITSRYAFLTMNQEKKDASFSYCYYLSLNNFVEKDDFVQLDDSAYGHCFSAHSKLPVVQHFLEYDKSTRTNYKCLLISCLKWIGDKIRRRVEMNLRNYSIKPNFEIVEQKQKRSNVKFRIGDRILYCNKELLAYKSNYYEALFFNDMKESKEEEIEIKDCSYETYRSMILFLVTGEVDITTDNVCDLLVICDRFGDLEGLKSACTRFLVHQVLDEKETLDNVWKLLKLASLHKCDKVLEVCSYCVFSNQNFFKEKLKELERDNPLWFFLCEMFLKNVKLNEISIK